MFFRALGTCANQHSKCLTTSKKTPWVPGDKKEKKKQCIVTIRMAIETIRKPCEDLVVSCASSHDRERCFNEMARVADGASTADATERFIAY